MRYLLRLAALVWLGAWAQFASALPFTGLYVFGDSLSDPGNVYAKTGGTFPPAPFYGSPTHPGRFSNGPVAAEYMAEQLMLSSAQVFNFAEGGAQTGTFNTNDPTGAIGLLGLQQQIGNYIAGVGGGTFTVDPTALYMVWAGPNNFLAGVSDPVAAITAALTDLGSAVGTLIAAGAKKILVPGLPDLGATPATLAAGADRAAGASALSFAFNTQLGTVLASLDGLGGADVIGFDTFGLVRAVIADPAAFGFSNVTQSCVALDFSSICSDPGERLFWDGVHPTTEAHAFVAQRFISAAVDEPHSVLLVLLGGVLLLRRRLRQK